MVKRTKITRVSGKFVDFASMLQKNVEPIVERKVSLTEITDAIAEFSLDEGFDSLMIRKARVAKRRRKRAGGLFG